MTLKIFVRRLCPEIPLPAYATKDSAGMDLRAASDVQILPGRTALVPTGLAVALPPGYEAHIRPRSGLAARYGISIPNAPGTIDSDYRGEISVILINLGSQPFDVHRGDRIAQMVIAPVVQAVWEEVETLDETDRGDGGFGHTQIR